MKTRKTKNLLRFLIVAAAVLAFVFCLSSCDELEGFLGEESKEETTDAETSDLNSDKDDIPMIENNPTDNPTTENEPTDNPTTENEPTDNPTVEENPSDDDIVTEEQPSDDEVLDGLLDDLNDVKFIFTKKQSGVCSISGIVINGEKGDNLDIEFPNQSPTGEDVVEISNLQIYSNYGLPTMFEKADFEELIGRFDTNDTNENFFKRKFKAYFHYQDLENAGSETKKDEMLKAYPITQVTPIYVLDSSASYTEIQKLVDILQTYAEYSLQDAEYYYKSIVNKVNNSDNSKENIAYLIKSIIPPIAIQNNITSVKLPSKLEIIGDYAFSKLTHLISIDIPSSVNSIGTFAFYNCINNLEHIIVDYGNTVYKSNGNCLIEIATNKLILGCKNSVIPDYVTSIEAYAFYNCSSLTMINIPKDVISIGDSAFEGCEKLIEVYNLSSLNIIKESTDNGYVGYHALDIYTSLHEKSKLHITTDGYVFYSNGSTNYLVEYLESDTELILPDNYNGSDYEIYKYAFYNNDKITQVIIPDSVNSIGNNSFSNCKNLMSIIIPNSVTNISYFAFYNCSKLTIYAEAESQPSGWSDYWNRSECTVQWGYKPE